ncbi:hypothetical protein PVK06_040960 [Gossypium arboreum]|uniref:Ycf2 N-terminal domain-containing protein n=1 Tax=Gossypium arboreum TaxID=29729 RepID=A0ABR0N6X6_GOSAR|nr:hypothetical protein PVK06_040960 [Gossypium arboreum]
MNRKRNIYTSYFYEENESFYRRIRKKWVRISCRNDLEDSKPKIVVFASNNIMEVVNQGGKQIIYDEKDELQKNDLAFLQSGTMQYQARDRSSKEQGFFQISQFIWDLANPLFFLFKDQPFVFVFSHRKFFSNEKMSKGLLTSQTDPPTFIYKHWFIKNTQENHFEL